MGYCWNFGKIGENFCERSTIKYDVIYCGVIMNLWKNTLSNLLKVVLDDEGCSHRLLHICQVTRIFVLAPALKIVARFHPHFA